MCWYQPGELIIKTSPDLKTDFPQKIIIEESEFSVEWIDETYKVDDQDFEIGLLRDIPEGREIEIMNKLYHAYPYPKFKGADFNYYIRAESSETDDQDKLNLVVNEALLNSYVNMVGQKVESRAGYKRDQRVRVALFDSGINPKLIKHLQINNKQIDNDMSHVEPYDDLGHGTLIARILDAMAGENIELLSAKVLNKRNRGTAFGLIRAINYVILNHQPEIISLSVELARRDWSCDHCGNSIQMDNITIPFMLDIVFSHWEFDHMIVACMGNSNRPEAPFPLTRIGIIGVGALNSKMEKASYSNYARQVINKEWLPYHEREQEHGVVLCAPGGDKNESLTDSNLAFSSYGTSFAVPFAVGLFSHLLMKSGHSLKELFGDSSPGRTISAVLSKIGKKVYLGKNVPDGVFLQLSEIDNILRVLEWLKSELLKKKEQGDAAQ